jgi:hypothetical protein
MVSKCLGLGQTVPVVQFNPWKRDTRFGNRIERSLFRLGSITRVATELGRYILDLLVVEVRWDKGATVRAGAYNFFLWKRKRKSSIENRIFCTLQNIIST